MRHISTLALIALSGSLFCQNIGINVTGAAPNASALLDVDGSGLPADAQRGILFPRVALTATNIAAPVVSPATSLVVYNTATAGTTPNDVVPGFYYWDGAAWKPFCGPATPPTPQCPVGFVRVPGRNYCIEVNERPDDPWDDANTICLNLGYRLCFPGEWRDACPNQAITEDNLGNVVPLQDMTGNEEWTWNLSPISTVPTLGVISCGNVTQSSIFSGLNFRCCLGFY